jgi:hypothetical protein
MCGPTGLNMKLAWLAEVLCVFKAWTSGIKYKGNQSLEAFIK